jgi:hypothetical protein
MGNALFDAKAEEMGWVETKKEDAAKMSLFEWVLKDSR